MKNFSIAEAAQLLGMKESEVVAVTGSPAGDLITTVDGTVLVYCFAPDADGKTGLMFLAAPTEHYGGSFPIYAQPGADADELRAQVAKTAAEIRTVEGETVEVIAVPPNPDAAVPDGSIATVIDWVQGDAGLAELALAAENRRDKPRTTLVAQLEELLATSGVERTAEADGVVKEPIEATADGTVTELTANPDASGSDQE